MPIPEKLVADVVKEAGAQMSDPRYTQMLVGAWVQAQPQATRYVAAHATELGGPEGVVNVTFHAQLVATCFRRHHGRSVRPLTFADLDAVASGDSEALLRERQPALADYLAANVEGTDMRRLLALLALAMDHVS